jgi:glycosyltransferase involved in cell wall biosynthesis
MSKKKLTICSPQLGISPSSDLGGEVYDREIIKAFCDLGIRVIVILPKNKPYLSHKNLVVYYLPFSFVWPPYLFNFLVIPYLFWLYKKEKFNVLRIHSPYFVGLGGLIFKIFHPSISLAATYHHLEEGRLLFNLVDKLFSKFWGHIFTVSHFTKGELRKKYGLRENKISVIYNGVSSRFKPKRKRKDLLIKYGLEGKETLLYLGGLKQRKNVGFLLEIIKRIKDLNIKLLICGQGALLNQLKSRTKELGLKEKVVFTGFIPEREKVNYYNLADIFLYPSQKEGFGLSVLEAASCGIPAIVSNSSSLKELVIDSKTGYLAELNDVDDWEKKVRRLLENESLRKKMGQKAQKFSQKFSWKKSAEKQIKIYQSLTINH